MDMLTQDQVDTIVNDLRYRPFPVLDNGQVVLVDVMGSDRAICDAARVSYGAGIQKRSDDITLIRYLMRHRHTTPFEMVEFKFRVRVPMDAWRQWIRHRTASVNEYSTRYSEAISDKQKTAPDEWRSQSQSNKQGSGDYLDPENLPELGQLWLRAQEAGAKAGGGTPKSPGEHLSEQEENLHIHANEVYRERLGFGVAREQARKDLPLSTYTEAYWKMDLHNLFHFLGLRMDSHAQQEIREYARTMGKEIVAKVVPVAWQAFCDYHLDAMHLTRLECEMIGKICRESAEQSIAGSVVPFLKSEFLSLQPHAWAGLKRCRERDECLEKLRRLGIVA